MLLGIDTGGTYTDAVLYDEAARRVVVTAKSPTTHHDLSIGICGAVDAVLAAGAVQPSGVELVSLSTTLATNALVEGKGRPVAAVIVGFDGYTDRPYYQSVKQGLDVTHYRIVLRTGGVWRADAEAQLIEATKAYLSMPSMHAAGRKKLVDELVGKVGASL